MTGSGSSETMEYDFAIAGGNLEDKL